MDTCLTLNYHMFNTFTVPGCKMSRLEDAVSKSVNWRFTPRQVKVARTCLRKYIRQSFNTSALNATCSGDNPFTRQCKKQTQKKRRRHPQTAESLAPLPFCRPVWWKRAWLPTVPGTPRWPCCRRAASEPASRCRIYWTPRTAPLLGLAPASLWR